ncbi:hypothetical protein BIW11_09448, partial [Tropilaelaps mercedesae]
MCVHSRQRSSNEKSSPQSRRVVPAVFFASLKSIRCSSRLVQYLFVMRRDGCVCRSLQMTDRLRPPVQWVTFGEVLLVLFVQAGVCDTRVGLPPAYDLMTGFILKGIERNVSYVETGSIVFLQCALMRYRTDAGDEVARIDWTLDGSTGWLEDRNFLKVVAKSGSQVWFRVRSNFSGTFRCESGSLASSPIHIK